MGSSSGAPIPSRCPHIFRRPRVQTPLHLCGAPRILLDVFRIRRLSLWCGHNNSDILLAPKGIDPGLMCCLTWFGRRLLLFVQGFLPMRTLWCALSLSRGIPSRVDDSRRAWRGTLLCLLGQVLQPDLSLGSVFLLLGRGLFFSPSWSSTCSGMASHPARATLFPPWDGASTGTIRVGGALQPTRATLFLMDGASSGAVLAVAVATKLLSSSFLSSAVRAIAKNSSSRCSEGKPGITYKNWRATSSCSPRASAVA